MIHTMPVINIYLDEELFEFVKRDRSRIIQKALRQFKERTDQSLDDQQGYGGRSDPNSSANDGNSKNPSSKNKIVKSEA